jgi:hypothetical protein
MPNQDEPLPAGPVEIEEISTEFIISDEPAAPAADPFAPPRAAQLAPAADPFAPPLAAPVVRARAAPAAPRAYPRATPELLRSEAGRPQDPAAPVVAPVPAPRPHRQGFPLLVALAFLLVGGGAGFFAGTLWVRHGGGQPRDAATPAAALSAPAPATAPASDADEPSTVKPKPTKKGAKPARKAPAAAKAPAAKGKVKLTAPAEAEVYLDGRRIGRGSMHVEVAAGAHRIEVRLGKAKVAERFEVEPHETWTYDVTPAK